MKKLSMLLAFCLLSVSLCGCQSQLTSSSQGSEVSAVSASSTIQEGDPVAICLDESLEQDMEELIRYLEASGNETEYELLVLPEDTEDREPELTRIRTEIMAGEGPDAFILSTAIPGAVLDPSTGETMESLFPNVEKSMYSHLFLDLEDMVQQSEIVDLENCNQAVMDVGVTGDGRFLLPLTYTFSGIMVDRSALGPVAAKRSGDAERAVLLQYAGHVPQLSGPFGGLSGPKPAGDLGVPANRHRTGRIFCRLSG